MARIKTLLKRISDLSLRAPKRTFAALAGLFLLAIYGLTQIVVDDGMQSVFSSDREEYSDYLALGENFSKNSNNVIVLFTSQNEIETRDLATLYDFVIDAQFLDEVEAVFSLFSLRSVDPESGQMRALFPVEFDESEDIRPLLTSVENSSFSGVSILSEDRRETVVILSLTDRLSDLNQAASTLTEIRELARTYEENGRLKISVTGLLPIREVVINGIRIDQAILNGVGGIFGFLMSLLIFRSFWIALLNGIAPIAALTFSLGVFGMAGLSINVLTNAVPVLILVLASSDCIHLTYEFRRQSTLRGDISTAIRKTVIDIGPPCILTSVTTMLAFASLLYSDSPLIKSLAISGVIGTGIALATVLIVHPLVFAFAAKVPVIRKAITDAGSAQSLKHDKNRLFSGLVKFSTPVTIGASCLLIVSIILFLPVQTKYRFFEFIDADEKIVQQLNHVESFSGPTMSIDIPLRVRGNARIFSNEILEEIREIHEELEKIDDTAIVISLHSLVRILKADNQVFTLQKLEDTIKLLPARYQNRLLSRDRRALLISLLAADIGSPETRARATRAQAIVRRVDAPSLEVGNATGFLVLSSRLSDVMIKQLSISFLIAAFFSPLLIGLWFRRADFAVAALVPNILPIAAVGAGLMLTGWHLQFSSALALTIAFGIALDDSIHVFNRLYLQLREDGGALTGPTIANAMRRITPALVTTTAVLSAGMAATQFSGMPTIRFFGILCIVVFALALAADLFLLPAIIARLNKKSAGHEK